MTDPTDVHQLRKCEACEENCMCEYHDTTLINGLTRDGAGLWLCDECYEDIRRQP